MSESISMLDVSARLPQHVVYRAFPTETVVLNLQTGKYHGLNPVGARMLDAIERAPTLREAAAQLAAQYGQPVETIEADLCEFCRTLEERGLIELGEAGEEREAAQ